MEMRTETESFGGADDEKFFKNTTGSVIVIAGDAHFNHSSDAKQFFNSVCGRNVLIKGNVKVG